MPEPDPPESRPLWRRCAQAAPVSAAILLLFFVYGARPIVALPGQWADDGLYLRHGEAVVHWLNGDGQRWLGEYDPVVLEKAPLFGIFLAFLNILRIPLRIAEFGLMVLGAFLFRGAVNPVTRLNGWRFALVTLVLVGLPCLPTELRLLRSALQLALSGACLSASIGLTLRAFGSGTTQGHWALLTGGLLGLAYLNREETMWLFPVVAGSALFVGAAGLWHGRWRRAIVAPVVIVLAFAIPVGVVKALNLRHYGVGVTTLRRAASFTRAHQILTSLQPEKRERFVPIVTATRLKAYAVSPTFARLQAYLEGEASDVVAHHPEHLAINGRPPGTREFFVTNFEFELRKAAYDAGARTAPDAEEMFRGIADELEGAIRRGEIAAGSRGPAVLAAPLPGDPLRILGAAAKSVSLLFQAQAAIPRNPVSSGRRGDLQRMRDLTHSTLAPTQALLPSALPDPLDGVRRAAFRALKALLRGCYLLGAVTVVALLVGFVLRRPHDLRDSAQAMAGLLLLAGLATFCLGMAVVETLAFPILYHGAMYNTLGFAPLSVLAAYGLVVLGDGRTLRAMASRPFPG